MITKTITRYTHLSAGWQDKSDGYIGLYASPADLGAKAPGERLVRVTLHLPCFGGSADAIDGTARAEVLP